MATIAKTEQVNTIIQRMIMKNQTIVSYNILINSSHII
jgi:hypothetical protein